MAGLLHTVFAVRGDCPALAHVHDDMLLQHLCHLQEHAVKKLKAKAAASSSPPSRSTASAATQNCLSLAGSCPVASGPIDVLVKVVGASVPDTQSAPGKKNVVSLSILPTCNGLKLGEEVLRKLFGNAEGKAVTEGSRERRASVRLIVQGRRVGEADAVLSGGQLTSRNGAQILAIVTQRDVETTGADRRKDDASEKILIRARRIREAALLMAQRDFHGDFELTVSHVAWH